MPLFICEECLTIDNTALGHYWSRNFVKFKDESKNNKALCSECCPEEFSGGSKNYKEGGVWHNKFEKQKFDKDNHNPNNFKNGHKILEMIKDQKKEK